MGWNSWVTMRQHHWRRSNWKGEHPHFLYLRGAVPGAETGRPIFPYLPYQNVEILVCGEFLGAQRKNQQRSHLLVQGLPQKICGSSVKRL